MTDTTSASPRQVALSRAAEVAGRIQGEVLAVPDACVVVADGSWPLSDLAAAQADAEANGLIAVPHPVDLVVLLTQTCDLQRTYTDAYLCQVAPVVESDTTFATQVARGRRPGWVALPWLDAISVGDLSRITTLERSVLVGAESLGRPNTPAERLRFAESVSRHLTRVALPDTIVLALAPMLERMRDRHDRQSPEGQCISAVASIRLEAVPNMDADLPDLTVLVVLESEDLPSLAGDAETDDAEVDRLVAAGIEAAARAALAADDNVSLREAWQALAELWIQPAVEAAASPDSGVGSVEVEVLNGDELSFARSRNAPELDLAYLTTRAA